MLLQNQLSLILDSQNLNFSNKNPGLERNKLEDLKITENFALIITGIRRCGKSTLLYQLLSKESDNALFLNFEDTHLASFETDDFA